MCFIWWKKSHHHSHNVRDQEHLDCVWLKNARGWCFVRYTQNNKNYIYNGKQLSAACGFKKLIEKYCTYFHVWSIFFLLICRHGLLDFYDFTVFPKKYAHGFVVLCFVVVMQSFIMNSHEVFIHIHQGCVADTGAIVRLPQCQWSKPDGYGKTSQCITTTKHSKAKTVCIFLGIYCKC